MNRIFKSIVLPFMALLPFAGCNVLDISPTDRFGSDIVWSTRESVDQYVIGFYAFLRESADVNTSITNYAGDLALFSDAYSDIVKSGSWDQYGHSFNRALLEVSFFTSTDAGPLACWSGDNGCYNKIRRHNEFLRDAPDHIDDFGEEFINSRMAEVRFIRAFAYYRLIRVYGGVVLRTELDGPEQNDKPRATEEESWRQVIDDLEYAAEYLPETPVQSGRLSKAAAYAMLSRVGLYYGRLNPEGWQIAIDAANECAKYSALSTGDGGYANVFADASNRENIFVINYSSGEIYHRADQYFRPSGDAAVYGATITSSFFPTSELVDSYEMADGSEFSWNVHGSDPYSWREPRFYATILYNGAEWEDREIQTYEGGTDGIIDFPHNTGAAGTTITGYYMKKWLTENNTDWITNGSTHFYIMLRYGEVLLNKAEALAQQNWAENGTEALQCLNDIRARVGLPARSATSLDEFMELLRQERKVELAGEGFRYWDLRRWRMAEDVIQNQQAHGCWITKDPDDGTLSYSQVEVDGGKTRVFLERYYAFSIPEVERSNNALLGENNKGW